MLWALFLSIGTGPPAPFSYFIKPGVEGVVVVNAEGNTAGQIARIIGDKDEKLLYILDAFSHPIHMEKLDWQTSFNFDHAKAKKTRSKLLQLAHTERMKINAFHFNFPGLSFAEKNGANWK